MVIRHKNKYRAKTYVDGHMNIYRPDGSIILTTEVGSMTERDIRSMLQLMPRYNAGLKEIGKGNEQKDSKAEEQRTNFRKQRTKRFIKINGEVGTVANMARKYKVDYFNLLHYSNGGKNRRYPRLKIEVADESEIQEYSKGESDRTGK